MLSFLRRSVGYCLVFSYVWAVLDVPVMAYALSGRDIVRASDTGVSASSEKGVLPFSTKIHVVVESETISSLCKRYNISLLGFNNLNSGRFRGGVSKKLSIGSTVIVPVRPLSNRLSHYLDGEKSVASSTASYVNEAAHLLKDNSDLRGRKGAVKQSIINSAGSAVGSKVTDFLGQYGTVQLNLSADDRFSFKNSQFAMLLPLYDKGRYLVFSQLSYHMSSNNRSIGNFGIGGRYFADSYMVGANAFFDYDFSRHLKRLGFGAEYSRNYLKASANVYFGQTMWYGSRDFVNMLERPAKGWDVRLQGYLPSKPELGGKLMFEQYYGDNVALFGNDNLQKDPYALTVGVDYTPVPLLNFNVDYKRGKGSQHLAHLGVNLNYRLGVPLAAQVEPSNVAKMRSLLGGRYDLVDRNNDMVLEYKKSGSIDIDAPQELRIRSLSKFNGLAAFASETAEGGKYNISEVGHQLLFDLYIHDSVKFENTLNYKISANAAYIAAGGSILVQSSTINARDAVYRILVKPPLDELVADNKGPFNINVSAADGFGHSAVSEINLKVERSAHPDMYLLVNPTRLPVGAIHDGVENRAPAQIIFKLKNHKGFKAPSSVCFDVKLRGSASSGKHCVAEPHAGLWVYQNSKASVEGDTVNYVSALLANSEALNGKKEATYDIVPVVGDVAYEDLREDVTIVKIDVKRPDLNKSRLLLSPNYIMNDDKDKMHVSYIVRNHFGSIVPHIGSSLRFAVESNGALVSDKDVHELAPIVEKSAGNYEADFVGNKVGSYKLVVYYKDSPVASGNFSIIDNNVLKGAKFTLSPSVINIYKRDLEHKPDEAMAVLSFSDGHKLGDLSKFLSLSVYPDDKSLTVGDLKYSKAGYVATLRGSVAGKYKITPLLGSKAISGAGSQDLTIISSNNNFEFDSSASHFSAVPGIMPVSDFNGGMKSHLNLQLAVLSGSVLLKDLSFKAHNSGFKIGSISYDNGIYSADLSVASKAIIAGDYLFDVAYKGKVLEGLQARFNLVDDKNVPSSDKSSFKVKPGSIYVGEDSVGTLKLCAKDGTVIASQASNISYDIRDAQGHLANNAFEAIKVNEQNGLYLSSFKTTKSGIYTIIPKYKNSYIGGNLSEKLVVKADDRDSSSFKGDLKISPSSIIDSGQESAIMTLKLCDKYGNKLEVKTKDLTIIAPEGGLARLWIKQSFETSEPGIYRAKLAGIGISVDRILLSVLYKAGKIGSGLSAPLSLTDPDDAPYGPYCYFGLSQDSILVHKEQAKIKFTAMNLYGKPLSNLDKYLSFVALDQNGKEVGVDVCQISPVVNKGSGEYEAMVSGNKSALVRLEPKYKQSQVGDCSADLKIYVDGTIDSSKSEFTVDKSQIKGNGHDVAKLIYQPHNKFGEAISGLEGLVFKSKILDNKISKSAIALKPITLARDMSNVTEVSPGVYQVEVKSTMVGSYELWVEYNGEEVSHKRVTLSVLADQNYEPDGSSNLSLKGNISEIKEGDFATLLFSAKRNGAALSGLEANNLIVVGQTSKGLPITSEMLEIGKFVEDGSSGVYAAQIKGIGSELYSLNVRYRTKTSGIYEVIKDLKPVSLKVVASIEKGIHGSITASSYELDKLNVSVRSSYLSLGIFSSMNNFVPGLGKDLGARILYNGVAISKKLDFVEGISVYNASFTLDDSTKAGAYTIIPLYKGSVIAGAEAGVTIKVTNKLGPIDKTEINLRVGGSSQTSLILGDQVKDHTELSLKIKVNGVLLSGFADAIKIQGLGKGLELGSFVENKGEYKAVLKGIALGNYILHPQIDDVIYGSSSVKVYVLSPDKDPSLLSGRFELVSSSKTLKAGSDEAILRLSMFKAQKPYVENKLPLINYFITPQTKNGKTYISELSYKSGGVYEGKFGGSLAGKYTVVARYGGMPIKGVEPISLEIIGNKDNIDQRKIELSSSPVPLVIKNGSAKGELSFKVKDIYGNLVYLGNLDSSAVPSDLKIGAAIYGSDGYKATLSSNKIGSYKVNVSAGSIKASIVVKVIDGSDLPDGNSTMKITPSTVHVGDQADIDLFLVQGKKALTNLDVSQLGIMGAIIGGDKIGPIIFENNHDGHYLGKFTGVITGRYELYATYKGVVIGGSAKALIYVKGDPKDISEKDTHLLVEPNKINTNSNAKLILEVKSRNHIGISGLDVGQFTIGDKADLLSYGSWQDKGLGIYECRVMSGSKIGGTTIGVSYKSFFNKSVDFEVLDDKKIPDSHQSSLTIDKSLIKANGKDVATLLLKARNRLGDSIASASDLSVIAYGRDGHVLSKTAQIEISHFVGKDGVFKASIKGFEAKDLELYVGYKGVKIEDLHVSLRLVSIDTKPVKSLSDLSLSKDKIKGNNNDTSIITFKALNASKQPITGLQNLVFKSLLKQSKYTRPRMELHAITLARDMSDIAEVSPGVYQVEVKSTMVGSYEIWVEYNGEEVSNKRVTLSVLADQNYEPDGSSVLSLKGSYSKNEQQYINANGTDQATIAVKLNRNNDPMGGYAKYISLSTDDASGVKIQDFIEDSTNQGIYITKVTSTKAGKYSFVLNYNGHPVNGIKPVDLYTSADKNDVDEAHSDVKGVDGVVTEIGSPTGTITLTLKDAHGNIMGKVAPNTISLTPNPVIAGDVTIDKTPIIDAAKGTYIYKVSAKKVGDYTINVQVGKTVFKDKKAKLIVLSDMPVVPSSLAPEHDTVYTNEQVAITLVAMRGKDQPITDDISQMISLKDGDTSFDFTKSSNGYTSQFSSIKSGVHKLELYYKRAIDGKEIDTNLSTAIKVSADNNPVDEDNSKAEGVDGVVTESGKTTGTIMLTLKDKTNNILGRVKPETISFDITPKIKNAVIINSDTPVVDEFKGTYTYKVSAKKAGDYKINIRVGSVTFKKKNAKLKVLSDMPVAPSTLEPEKTIIDTGKNVIITLVAMRGKDQPIADDISQMIVLKDGDTSFGFKKTSDGYTSQFSSTKSGVHKLELYYKAPLDKEVDTKINTTIDVTSDNNSVDEDMSDVKGVDGLVVENDKPTGKIALTLKDAYGNIMGNIDPIKIKFTMATAPTGAVKVELDKVDKAKGVYNYKVRSNFAGEYDINVQVNDVIFTKKKAHLKVLSDMPVAPSTLEPEKTIADTGEDVNITLTPYRKDGSSIDDDISGMISLKDGNDVLSFNRAEDNKYVAKFNSIVVGKHNLSLYYRSLDSSEVNTGVSTTIKVTAENNPPDPDKSKVTIIFDKEGFTDNGLKYADLKVTLKDKYDNPIANRQDDILFDVNPTKHNKNDIDINKALQFQFISKDDSTGVYNFKVTSLLADTYTISVIAVMVRLNQTAEVTVCTDTPSDQYSSFDIPYKSTHVGEPLAINFYAMNASDKKIMDDISSRLTLWDNEKQLDNVTFTHTDTSNNNSCEYKSSKPGKHIVYLKYKNYYDGALVKCSTPITIQVIN